MLARQRGEKGPGIAGAGRRSASDPFARLGRFAVRRRWAIVLVWAVILLVAIPLAPRVVGVLRAGGFILDDLESARAKALLQAELATPPSAVVIVYHSNVAVAGTPAFETPAAAAAEHVPDAPYVARIVPHTLSPRQVSTDGHTAYDIVFLSIAPDDSPAALSTGIANTQSGNVRVLEFHTAGTYTGGTTITSQSIRADVSGAFGTGTITVNSTANTTNSSQILIAPGVTIANNITVSADNPHPVNTSGPFGVIQPTDLTDTGSDVVLTGTITVSITAAGTGGTGLGGDGLFNGPIGNTFLEVNGKVTVGQSVNTIVQIGGNVKYGNATSSYGAIMVNGLAKLGITNGLATNSVLKLSQVALSGVTGSGALANPSAGTIDLAGFNQTAVALAATSGTLTSTVENTGATPSTLTLTTTAANDTAGTNSYNGVITGNINLLVNGNGSQLLTGANSDYQGTTTISGTAVLAASALNDGGTASSIGGASNAAAMRPSSCGSNIDSSATMQSFTCSLQVSSQ
jgi:hypothetical protein